MVSCLGTAQGPPASEAMLRHFLTSWSSCPEFVCDMEVSRIDDAILATSIVTQCRNSFPRSIVDTLPIHGFWAFPNYEYLALCSLMPKAERLEVLEGAEDPQSSMTRMLRMREAAQVRLDTDGRVRRALLHKSTPTSAWQLRLLLQSPDSRQELQEPIVGKDRQGSLAWRQGTTGGSKIQRYRHMAANSTVTGVGMDHWSFLSQESSCGSQARLSCWRPT